MAHQALPTSHNCLTKSTVFVVVVFVILRCSCHSGMEDGAGPARQSSNSFFLFAACRMTAGRFFSLLEGLRQPCHLPADLHYAAIGGGNSRGENGNSNKSYGHRYLYERAAVTSLWTRLSQATHAQWRVASALVANDNNSSDLHHPMPYLTRLVHVGGAPGVGKSSAVFGWLRQTVHCAGVAATWIDVRSGNNSSNMVYRLRHTLRDGVDCTAVADAHQFLQTNHADVRQTMGMIVVVDGLDNLVSEADRQSWLSNLVPWVRLGMTVVVLSSSEALLPRVPTKMALATLRLASWTLEEYQTAVQDDVFWKSLYQSSLVSTLVTVQQKSAEDEGRDANHNDNAIAAFAQMSVEDRHDAVAQAHVWAGGCVRFLWSPEYAQPTLVQNAVQIMQPLRNGDSLSLLALVAPSHANNNNNNNNNQWAWWEERQQGPTPVKRAHILNGMPDDPCETLADSFLPAVVDYDDTNTNNVTTTSKTKNNTGHPICESSTPVGVYGWVSDFAAHRMLRQLLAVPALEPLTDEDDGSAGNSSSSGSSKNSSSPRNNDNNTDNILRQLQDLVDAMPVSTRLTEATSWHRWILEMRSYQWLVQQAQAYREHQELYGGADGRVAKTKRRANQTTTKTAPTEVVVSSNLWIFAPHNVVAENGSSNHGNNNNNGKDNEEEEPVWPVKSVLLLPSVRAIPDYLTRGVGHWAWLETPLAVGVHALCLYAPGRLRIWHLTTAAVDPVVVRLDWIQQRLLRPIARATFPGFITHVDYVVTTTTSATEPAATSVRGSIPAHYRDFAGRPWAAAATSNGAAPGHHPNIRYAQLTWA